MKFCSGIASLYYVGVTFFEMCSYVLCWDGIFCSSQCWSEFSVIEALYSCITVSWKIDSHNPSIFFGWQLLSPVHKSYTLSLIFVICHCFPQSQTYSFTSSGNANILSSGLSSLCGIIFLSFINVESYIPKASPRWLNKHELNKDDSNRYAKLEGQSP